MKTCPECGGRVYSRGCVNCDEDAYITEQEALNSAGNFTEMKQMIRMAQNLAQNTATRPQAGQRPHPTPARQG